jgi:hypothetical protein
VIQRRLVVGIVAVAAFSMLAACGFQSPDVEATEHASVQAADFTVGSVDVGDAFVTSVSGGAGGGSSLFVSATFVNNALTTTSTLTGVTTPLGTATINSAAGNVIGGALALPPKGVPVVVEAGAPSALSGQSTQSTVPTITIETTTTPALGTYVPARFTFSGGESSPVIQLPVVPPGETTSATQPLPTGVATPPIEPGVSASD